MGLREVLATGGDMVMVVVEVVVEVGMAVVEEVMIMVFGRVVRMDGVAIIVFG